MNSLTRYRYKTVNELIEMGCSLELHTRVYAFARFAEINKLEFTETWDRDTFQVHHKNKIIEVLDYQSGLYLTKDNFRSSCNLIELTTRYLVKLRRRIRLKELV